MKHHLLRTSAIALIAMAAAPAYAADAPVTSGLQLKISGFVGFQGTLVVNQSGNGSLDRDYDFASGGRLQFDVKNVTDSGLEYGARIRFSDVNRKDNVKVDRTYVYLKGDFGTITFGDAPSVAGDYGYVFAHDSVVSGMGLDGNYGDNIDRSFAYGGGNFFSLDPTYISGLGKDTKIKYTSPTLGGFSFAADFTPVVGGDNHAGPGGRKDLINDDKTVYENVVGGGVNYKADFNGTSFLVSGTATTGNGVKGNKDLEAYSLGAQIGSGGITGSVNWVHYSSISSTDKAIDTVSGSLAYQFGAFEVGLGYAYTTAAKGNGLKGDADHGDDGRSDLKANHVAAATVVYTLAPGLNTFGELAYESQKFRQGPNFDNTTLSTGLLLSF